MQMLVREGPGWVAIVSAESEDTPLRGPLEAPGVSIVGHEASWCRGAKENGL